MFFLSNPYSWPSDDVAWGKKIFDLRHCFINKMLSTLDFASGLKTNIAPNIYPETEVPPGSPHHRDYFRPAAERVRCERSEHLTSEARGLYSQNTLGEASKLHAS